MTDRNDMPAQLSVVVCSLGQQDVGAAVESIVRSADDARTLVDVVVVWQGDRPPPVLQTARVLDVFPVGLSYARNRGARASSSPFVGFVDDDEVVDRGWVKAVLASFEEVPAAAGAFGPVAPLEDLARMHSRYEGDERRVFTARRTGPWFVGTGGNMAFRRDSLLAAGGFDLRFGAGAAAYAAEDWDIIVRLLRAGRALVWSPEMVVYHPAKAAPAELRSRYPYGFGVGHLVRRHRAGSLGLRYAKAMAEMLAKAGKARDRRRLREGAATLGGFLAGALSRARAISPAAALARAPAELRAGTWRAEPMLLAEDPELRYRDADGRLLRVRVNPGPELERQLEDRAEVEAVISSRDALWVVTRPV